MVNIFELRIKPAQKFVPCELIANQSALLPVPCQPIVWADEWPSVSFIRCWSTCVPTRFFVWYVLQWEKREILQLQMSSWPCRFRLLWFYMVFFQVRFNTACPSSLIIFRKHSTYPRHMHHLQNGSCMLILCYIHTPIWYWLIIPLTLIDIHVRGL